MPKSEFVRVRQNGDSGPMVEVAAAYAKGLGLTPVSDKSSKATKSSARRRAAEPSHSGDTVASTPEEATE